MRELTRAAMRGVARDETAATGGRGALVLAPHPDDETLGCGATILRKVASGTPVTVAVLTDGAHSHRSAHLSPAALAALRRVELGEAIRRLGLPAHALRHTDFVDGTLAAHEDELVGYLQRLLKELRPDEVYTTCANEPHPDHAALGRAARTALARADVRARLLEYPVWLWGSWPLRRGDRVRSVVDAAGILLRRRVVIVRSAEYLPGKLHALRAHASQLRRPDAVPDSEDWPALPASVLDAAGAPAELFLTPQPRT